MVFGLFKSKKKSIEDFLKNNENNILKLELNKPLDCICDFTYDFVWQSNFDYNQEVVDGVTYKDLVEHLKNKGIVYIKGDVGHRFCSSMGADLKYFGGNGGKLNVGIVIVDGDVDTRFGISMVSGTVYVNEKNKVNEPMGNIIEVESDIKGYKKFISITEFVEGRYKQEKLLKPNKFNKNDHNLVLNDKIIRDTVGARLEADATIVVNGNTDLSTGLLMKKGTIVVNGDAGKNTGAVLKGGTVIINGNTGDFTAFEMKKGTMVVDGDAGKFLGARRKGGIIYAREGSPTPPTKKYPLDSKDKEFLNSLGFVGEFYKFK